ncbi:MAG: zf-HC2 domain-containing protein, partial [Gemmatimonadota bacterium]
MNAGRAERAGWPTACADVREALFAWLDREVAAPVAERIARHVDQCAGCAAAAARDRALLALVRGRGGAPGAAAPTLRARIARALAAGAAPSD